MLNQVVLVGRLARDLEVKKLDSGKEVANITLAVPRAYKNEEGVYETDFIDCTLWNIVAKNTAEYCKKGDLLGVKGKIQTTMVDDKKVTEVVAEKVTFLSIRKDSDNE
jgi:single-strand DNA-binding protein